MTPDPITWKEAHVTTLKDAKTRREAPLDTPTDLTSNATRDISGALIVLLADMSALYVKTKNFHWHMSGPHFRDYHLLLDEQGEQIFATTDDVADSEALEIKPRNVVDEDCNERSVYLIRSTVCPPISESRKEAATARAGHDGKTQIAYDVAIPF
jgi:hypothetical protein